MRKGGTVLVAKWHAPKYKEALLRGGRDTRTVPKHRIYPKTGFPLDPRELLDAPTREVTLG